WRLDMPPHRRRTTRPIGGAVTNYAKQQLPQQERGRGRRGLRMRFEVAWSELPRKRAIVYVDGFNLYYGCLRGTPYRWLNISKLTQYLLPNDQILQINYYTALVSARPHDPDQPIRQNTYIRALKTIPHLTVTLG